MTDLKSRLVVSGLFDADQLIAQRQWEPLAEGVQISTIYADGEDGARAAFLNYAPGARVAAHHHAGYEHILILHGDQSDGLQTYTAGMLIIQVPGSQHEIVSSGGCLALGVWQRPVRFVGKEY